MEQINENVQSSNEVIKRVIVQGKGGSGKSTLIHAMTANIANKIGASTFLLMAPTGSAAVNIGGTTIHSTLNIGINGEMYKLEGQQLRPFGKSMTSGNTANGRTAYYGFQKCFILGDSLRQAGTDYEQVNFRKVLDRLSLGQSTECDWLRINQRTISKIHNFREKFKDALRLFPTNDLTVAYNEQKLRDLGQPVAKIKSKHNIPCASNASSDLAQGLLPELLLAIGSRVMLRSNLWTDKGLVNGALGTVRDIVYKPGDSPTTKVLPICIMIHWDNYSGPLLNSSFPLCAVTRHWKKDGTNYSWTQFPIVLALAVTIHKSQGMTLVQAVIDIGAKNSVQASHMSHI